MADKDKTTQAKPKPGGTSGPPPSATTEPAENGARDSETAHPDPTRPDPTRPDPTRYGDWEINGRCIDF